MDVFLLSDKIEIFRDVSLSHYKLDPVQYFTILGFAWDSMLGMIKQKLELSTNDQFLMFEQGIRCLNAAIF